MKLKKLLSLGICVVLLLSVWVPSSAATSTPSYNEKTVYVSSQGSDENAGTEDAPFKTFEKAWYNPLQINYTIVIMDDVAIQSSTFVFDDDKSIGNRGTNIFIKGATPDVVFNISVKKEMGLYCPHSLTFDNITLGFADKTSVYANGRILTITDSVTFTNRIYLYGGYKSTDVFNTNLIINGGKYYEIYGGSRDKNITGNVNMFIGGNVNSGDGINPNDIATLSPCAIYGGSYKGLVYGDVNVTFGGDARANCLVGAGRLEGALVKGDININITGGRIANIYSSRVAQINTNVAINVTGGVVAAVYGGAELVSVSGSTMVYIGPGATISRCVYGGCYNDSAASGTNKVIGQTVVIIDNGCSISTGEGITLSSGEDMGIHAGSRSTTNFDDEINLLVFVNNGYSTYAGQIGGVVASNHDYLVQAEEGGTVKESAVFGAITLIPDENKAALIDSCAYANGYVYELTDSVTTVEFTEDYYSVVYDYNNGTGKTFEVAKVADQYLTIIKNTESNGDLRFIGWATSKDATEPDYLVGSGYSTNADITLYAVWRVNDTEYSVMHIIETYNGRAIYKNETKPGVIGMLTEAEAFDLLGYTLSSPVLQETLSEEMYTVIPVNYVMGEGTVKDVNLDGRVNLRDAALLRRFIAEWEGYDGSKVCYFTSDINGDNTVNLTDAVQLQRYLAGWENLAG